MRPKVGVGRLFNKAVNDGKVDSELVDVTITIKEKSDPVIQSFTYKREKAIKYAKDWCGTCPDGQPCRNSEYEAYDHDCANFVSQCLIAGGLGPSIEKYIESGRCPPEKHDDKCIISCTYLQDFLVNYLGATCKTSKGEGVPEGFEQGDVAIFHTTKHAVFAVEDENHQLVYYDHFSRGDHCGVSIQNLFEQGWNYCTYYHIPEQPSPNQPPTVTIISPADGSTFSTGDPITFQGSATDPEDGPLTGSSLVWTSSIDGQIGTGESFSTSTLSVGTHVITLTATDSQGAKGTASVTITVTTPPGPAKGKIAFVSDRDGDADIFVMNTDGSDQHNITNDPNNWDEHPAWSPDGTKIAFTSDRHGNYEIYVMNADGSDQRNITNAHPYNAPAYYDRDPVWSPDGTKIAFASSRDGKYEIYVMNADGSDQHNITNDPDYDDREPAWSPDGTKIAFISNRDGNWEIYVMNADGSGQRNITNSSLYDDGRPAWSPDGAKIAFWASYCDQENIYVMNADGSNVQTLTNPPGYYREPAWSPDGTKIAFRSGGADIFIMNADGTNPRNITNDPHNWDWWPAWSPVLP